MPLPVPPEIEETMKIRGGAAWNGRPVFWAEAASPSAVDGRLDRPADAFRDAVQVVDKGQASQRAETLRLQRAGNVVDPSPAQPLQMVARLAAVIGRLAQRQEDRRIVARAAFARRLR